MALIKCSECGNKISDRAISCVFCGCPMSEIINDYKKIELIQSLKEIENQKRNIEKARILKEIQNGKTESELENKKNTQMHITWSNIFDELEYLDELTEEICKANYYNAVLNEDLFVKYYLEEEYYVEPKIHEYLKNNKFLLNKWDTMFDLYIKRHETGYKLSFKLLIEAAENNYFKLLSYKGMQEDRFYNFSCGSKCILKFDFEEYGKEVFIINGIILKLTRVQRMMFLQAISEKCYNTFIKYENETERIRKEIEFKKKEEIKKIELLKKKKETQKHINWYNLFDDLEYLDEYTAEIKTTSYYSAVLNNSKEKNWLEDEYYVEPEVHEYLKHNNFTSNKWDTLFDIKEKCVQKNFQIPSNYLYQAIKDGYFVQKKLDNDNKWFCFTHGKWKLEFLFNKGGKECFELNGIKMLYNRDVRMKLLEALSPKCKKIFDKYEIQQEKERCLIKGSEQKYSVEMNVYSSGIEEYDTKKQKNSCMYCGRYSAVSNICGQCYEQYFKTRKRMGGYPASDPSARGSNGFS